MNNKLTNVRLRHSALNAIHGHIKTYLECMERDYYGQRSDQEQAMCLRLKELLQVIQGVCWSYFDEEGQIIESGEVHTHRGIPMSHIKMEDRRKFDDAINNLYVPDDAGELNYLITFICDAYLQKKGKQYANINEVIGVLECSKQEFYDRNCCKLVVEEIKIN